MSVWALLTPAGCIAAAGISKHPPEGHKVLPPGLTPEAAPRLRWLEGEWLPRPELPAPLLTPGGLRIEACPAGVICEVCDRDTGVLLGTVAAEDGLLSLDLPDPGAYRLTLSVPEPFLAPEPLTLVIPEP
jgi:hypothetical protein